MSTETTPPTATPGSPREAGYTAVWETITGHEPSYALIWRAVNAFADAAGALPAGATYNPAAAVELLDKLGTLSPDSPVWSHRDIRGAVDQLGALTLGGGYATAVTAPATDAEETASDTARRFARQVVALEAAGAELVTALDAVDVGSPQPAWVSAEAAAVRLRRVLAACR